MLSLFIVGRLTIEQLCQKLLTESVRHLSLYSALMARPMISFLICESKVSSTKSSVFPSLSFLLASKRVLRLIWIWIIILADNTFFKCKEWENENWSKWGVPKLFQWQNLNCPRFMIVTYHLYQSPLKSIINHLLSSRPDFINLCIS